MEEIKEDPRFAHTLTDPRFRRPHIKQRKIKIDSRFKSMLKDKEFSVKYSVDKRGRPINTSAKENLERLYDYESEEEDESSREEDTQKQEEEDELPSDEDDTQNPEEEDAEDESTPSSDIEENKHSLESSSEEDGKFNSCKSFRPVPQKPGSFSQFFWSCL